MAPDHVEALVETAPDGVAFDGLRVEREDGYQFRTADRDRRGLDEEALRELARDAPAVRNWYFWHARAPQREDHWTFLRWFEGVDRQEAETETAGATDARMDHTADTGTDHTADAPEFDAAAHYARLDSGVDREWGELLLTVALEDGRRQYSIRHVDDAGADADGLDEHRSPGEAREIARFDGRGRYRPLKTAPTLKRGWRFAGLDAAALLETVGYLYPATVENWYRERAGDLDVTHWRETVERQTGIYSVVQTWDRGEGHDHVEWVAETCCDDSQCLKRRRWAYDEDTELAVDGGDGAFPCREPCSLVISAAREWTRLEGEESQSYEFELTPSEKAQIEAIIDAVADGCADEVREADFGDDANRWRARFLRAKLFDDEGRLDGVPTDRE
jgi:hypothetical protein